MDAAPAATLPHSPGPVGVVDDDGQLGGVASNGLGVQLPVESDAQEEKKARKAVAKELAAATQQRKATEPAKAKTVKVDRGPRPPRRGATQATPEAGLSSQRRRHAFVVYPQSTVLLDPQDGHEVSRYDTIRGGLDAFRTLQHREEES